tara:strand:+ start:228 stop:551 length:324 start_codon:yes stop_codon:yes gene_type:complete
MSEENNQFELDEETAKQNVPLGFLLSITKALESRVDYNFNNLIQLSLLIEFLYESLEKQGIKIPLDQDFESFQEKRIEEIKKEFDKQVNKEIEQMKDSESNLDLKDD